MKQNNYWLLALVLVVGMIAGYFLRIAITSSAVWQRGLNLKLSMPRAGEEIKQARGTVISASDRQVKFSLRLRSTDGWASQERTAVINEITTVYLLEKKSQEEILGKDLAKRQETLKQDLTAATDRVEHERLLTQLREIKIEADKNKDAAVSEIQAKLSNNSGSSAERQEWERQLSELNSDYKYKIIKAGELKEGEIIEVWSEANMATNNNFSASKLEVKR